MKAILGKGLANCSSPVASLSGIEVTTEEDRYTLSLLLFCSGKAKPERCTVLLVEGKRKLKKDRGGIQACATPGGGGEEELRERRGLSFRCDVGGTIRLMSEETRKRT